MESSPFHAAQQYEYAADLREYGHRVRLSLYNRRDKQGNHKLEILDAGEMKRAELLDEITQIFDIETQELGIMRVDFAVDIHTRRSRSMVPGDRAGAA